MRKTLAAAAIVAASTATSACGMGHSEDGGPTASRNYQVGAFDEVVSAGAYDVIIRTGSAPSVSARGPQKALDHLVVEIRNGKLEIHPEKQNSWFHRGVNYRGKVEVTVTVPQLKGATLAGAGDMRVDKIQGDRFDGTLAGAGNLQVDNVQVQSLKLTIAGAGDAKLGGGSAQTADYTIAGAGDMDAKGVWVQQAKVSIAGSGSVSAHVSSTAEVSIVGAGDVDVTGGAKCSVHKLGAGDVRCS
jgi:hypothetical protein